MLFQDPDLLAIQGLRSRGFGRNWPESSRARSGVLEDPGTHPWTGYIWVFPRLFPQRDSRYNTMIIGQLSPLALEGQRASQGGIGPSRASWPKGNSGK